MMCTTLSVNISCNIRDGHSTIHRPERLTNKEDLRGDPKIFLGNRFKDDLGAYGNGNKRDQWGEGENTWRNNWNLRVFQGRGRNLMQ